MLKDPTSSHSKHRLADFPNSFGAKQEEHKLSASTFNLGSNMMFSNITKRQIKLWAQQSKTEGHPTSSKRRALTEEDMASLQVFKEAKNLGIATEDLLSLPKEYLQRIGTIQKSILPFLEDHQKFFAAEIDRFLGFVGAFDDLAAEKVLCQLARTYRPRELYYGVFQPLIAQIDSSLPIEVATTGEERIVVNALRTLLSAQKRIQHIFKRDDVKRNHLLFATQCDQRRELECLAAAILCCAGGLDTLYLGADVAYSEITRIATSCRLDTVVLDRHPKAESKSDWLCRLVDLKQGLPETVQLLVFGSIHPSEKELFEEENIGVISSYAEMEEFLLLQGASF